MDQISLFDVLLIPFK